MQTAALIREVDEVPRRVAGVRLKQLACVSSDHRNHDRIIDCIERLVRTHQCAPVLNFGNRYRELPRNELKLCSNIVCCQVLLNILGQRIYRSGSSGVKLRLPEPYLLSCAGSDVNAVKAMSRNIDCVFEVDGRY
jgi:hypothetical protein